MPKHQTKVVAIYSLVLNNIKKPNQTYENLEVWINIDRRPSFFQEIYSKETDIFGIVNVGVEFADDKAVEIIVDLFDQHDSLKYIISKEEIRGNRAIFCKKKLVDKDGTGFEVDIYKEKDLISIEGLFKIVEHGGLHRYG